MAVKTNSSNIIRQWQEERYLHQTVIDGIIYDDIPDVPENITGNIISHFHVPLHKTTLFPHCFTTFAEMEPIWQSLRQLTNLHLEIETYSFSEQPLIDSDDLIASIANEYQSVIQKLGE